MVHAIEVVQRSRPSHVPMWGLHKGTQDFVRRLQAAPETGILVEFDVTDCFLNTPRELVGPALAFWLERLRGRAREGPWFAVSRDGKAGDYLGRPCSVHYWALKGAQIGAAVEWELAHNAGFEATMQDGTTQVLEQVRGLPIGGHFSAALVEFVALWKELTEP